MLLGIDAGATWIKVTRFSSDFTREKTVKIPSGAKAGIETYCGSLARAVKQVGGGDSIGVAVPGTVSSDGHYLLYAANIAGLTPDDHAPYNLRYALREQLGVEHIVLANDAACAALAEWQHGVGEADATKTLLHLTWGTGIGTAIVQRGQVSRMMEGGHLPLGWGEVADVETLCAVPHLVKKSGLAPTKLLAAAEAGEEVAAKVVDDAAAWLARGLHMMSVLVYPDIVTIGGGFMATEWLLEQVRHHVGQEKSGYLGATLRPNMVYRAKLGNDAGMIGAALLAKEKLGGS